MVDLLWQRRSSMPTESQHTSFELNAADRSDIPTLGLFVVPLHFPERELVACWEEDRDTIVHAEALDFAEGWVGEHYCNRWENQASPELLLSQAFALTKRIRLGTGIKVIGYHHPAELAHKIAALDHLSHGRFMFGIGPGGAPTDFEMMGISPRDHDASERMRESIDMMREMWSSQGAIDREGKFWRLKIPLANRKFGWEYHIKPKQAPHPPIAVAGTSPNSRTLRWGGEQGFLPLSFFDINASIVRSQWEAYAEGAEKGGRKPDRKDWRIARVVYAAETDDIARAHLRESSMPRAFNEHFKRVIQIFGGLFSLKHDESVADEDVTADYMLDNVWMVGSPDTVCERLERFYEDVGGFGTLLMVHFDTHPHPERFRNSMRLMQEEVMPKLRQTLRKRATAPILV
ncbi:LLM class flavin-dependent oxidoreductase [Phaeobacter sp. B1627]|uniref:LLM class flavin-dependent oxidoreductase n=1 Tax=Phaeobacter sp. B1627 TaxID=2583809 RepID=UPI001117C2F1|nr:LLM class flavin-dependent oxidoreductase [Phaeobacter sp. B1627]TNJ42315.1 LLM class flavin-dependent oxidoreductase [Phaeobacter sp. B1627]